MMGGTIRMLSVVQMLSFFTDKSREPNVGRCVISEDSDTTFYNLCKYRCSFWSKFHVQRAQAFNHSSDREEWFKIAWPCSSK